MQEIYWGSLSRNTHRRWGIKTGKKTSGTFVMNTLLLWQQGFSITRPHRDTVGYTLEVSYLGKRHWGAQATHAYPFLVESCSSGHPLLGLFVLSCVLAKHAVSGREGRLAVLQQEAADMYVTSAKGLWQGTGTLCNALLEISCNC